MNKNEIIPKLRSDIVFRIVENGDKKNILLYDESQIANQPLLFPEEFATILQFFDGKTTLEQLEKIVAQNYAGNVQEFMNHFINLMEDLNLLCYLETPFYFKIRDDFIAYMNSPVRKSVCAGSSYPTDKTEAEKYFQNIFSKSPVQELNPNINAIIVPHIDFVIGEPAHKIYAKAYNTIAKNNYDTFVILGTSHYGNSDYFMFTYKDFETPFGIAKTDKEFIRELADFLPFEITIDEQAHRFEHSIEFPVVCLQYLYKKPNLKFIPILVGPFNEFIYQNTFPSSNDRISAFFDTFRRKIYENFKNPLFIASVDFAHVGPKFNDPFDGMEKIKEVQDFDNKLIEQIKNCNPDGFLEEVIKVQDRYKICGLSPIYSLLSIVQPHKGKLLGYDFWDDSANKSIVSFASFCFEP
jgi:AmmeMemoRadiSam system protein B